MVASIGSGRSAPRARRAAAALLGVRLAHAGDEARSRVSRRTRRRARRAARRGAPRASATARAAGRAGGSSTLRVVLDPLPGRRAVGVVEDHAALDDHRLAPVDRRHRHAATRETRSSFATIGACSSIARPSTRATASRVTSSSVGPRPPVSTTRSARVIAAATSAATRRPIADDVLGPDADAERGQALGDGERVGVEARRHQQLRADRDDLGASKRRGRRGPPLTASMPGTAQTSARMIA